MDSEEILNGNKEIGRFMKKYKSPSRYNLSWNWLMPVVEKIESMGYKVIISDRGCVIYKEVDKPIVITEKWDTKLIGTYVAILEFLDSYKNE